MHHQSERPPDPRRAAKGAMRVAVRKEPPSALSDYASVPIAFSTTTVLEVEWIANGLGGVRMVEAALGQSLTKDFDGDEPVMSWRRFGDISHWGIFAAFSDEQRVGGAVVAHNSPGIHMLEGARGSGGLVGSSGASQRSSKRRWYAPARSRDPICAGVRLFVSEGRIAEHQPRSLSLLRQARSPPWRLASRRVSPVPR